MMKLRTVHIVISVVVVTFAMVSAAQASLIDLDEAPHWTPDNVRSALDAGADPDARDNSNRTPLMFAANWNTNPAVLQVLLDAGAEPDARDEEGWTPLMFAANWNNNPEVLQVLLDAGADPDARDNSDRTSLMFAAYRNDNPLVLQVLLDAGANLRAGDKHGWTPLMFAADNNNNPAVLQVLLDAGAADCTWYPDRIAISWGSPDVLAVSEWSAKVVEIISLEGVELTVTLENTSTHDVRMIDGQILFEDALGRSIAIIQINEDAQIPVSGSLTQSGRYTRSGAADITRLATVDAADIAVSACVKAIVTTDGNVLRFD